MSLKVMERTPSGNCPVCDCLISGPKDVEVSEILYCRDCESMLVVEVVNGSHIELSEAPEMEEDWGE